LIVVRGLELKPAPDGAYPDPGTPSFLRTRNGLILTNAQDVDGTVLVWDSTGRFLRSVGRAGDAPGELSADYRPGIHVAQADSIYVNERRRITVLAPDLTYVRIINTPKVGSDWLAFVVTDSGGFIYSGTAPNAPQTHWFHYSDRNGMLLRSFGPIESGQISASRWIGYGGGKSFWAVPSQLGLGGYTLEEWNTDGQFVRAIRRNVEWFDDPAAADELVAPPAVQVHVDSLGLLWVTAFVRKPGASVLKVGAPIPSEYFERSMEIWLEVIDPNSGTLLASALITDIPTFIAMGQLPSVWIPKSRESVTTVRDSQGLGSLVTSRWYLVKSR
jgi:hypothetical protein